MLFAGLFVSEDFDVQQPEMVFYEMYDSNHPAWSCFYAAEMFLSLMTSDRVLDTISSKKKRIRRSQVKGFLKPGNVYHISITDHDFSVAVLSDHVSLYCDYFMETGRKDWFRLEVIDGAAVESYLLAYLDGDYRADQRFHRGDNEFLRDRSESIAEDPGYLDVISLPLDAPESEGEIVSRLWRTVERSTHPVKSLRELIDAYRELIGNEAADTERLMKTYSETIGELLCSLGARESGLQPSL